jgi:ectoine hydroxylase-related dioxygenase (phytanoyl-CoA dioxygenase family)
MPNAIILLCITLLCPVAVAFIIAGSSSRAHQLEPLNYGLYEVQEEMLVRRGILEEELMAGNGKTLEANKPRGVGSSGGFGGSKGGSSVKSSSKDEGKAHAEVLREKGVVRIDGVLSNKVADQMRDFVFDLRETATAEVEAGSAKLINRFADVLLKSNRCDLTIPFGPEIVTKSLQQILAKSSVRDTIEELLSPDAILYELSCLISDPGSQRQNVHPDNPFLDEMSNEPTLLTCFVALQDIDISMGPTVWIPGTHTKDVHEKFQDETPGYDGEESSKDRLLRTRPHVLGMLKKGSCAIFDSRLLHCGSANRHEDISRALFYFSFKNPKVGYPGNPASIRREIGAANLGLEQLSQELEGCKGKKNSPALEALAAQLK